jgi:HlyD family secretion protein
VLQGYGEADYIYLSSQETGVVDELFVREGDRVEAGARVFTLDPDRLALSAKCKRAKRGGGVRRAHGASAGHIGAEQLRAWR